MKIRFPTLLGGALLLLGGTAQAAVIDVLDFDDNTASTYFTPAGSEYSSPYYRQFDEDWGWTHNAIAGAGTATSIDLSISAWDVDAPAENDVIEAWDAGTSSWLTLGSLAGASGVWSYTTFSLAASLFDDVAAGLMVRMDIDANNSSPTWLVSLAKSVVSVDGATIPNPNPNPVPAPGVLALLGLGLVGFGAVRRRKTV